MCIRTAISMFSTSPFCARQGENPKMMKDIKEEEEDDDDIETLEAKQFSDSLDPGLNDVTRSSRLVCTAPF